MSTPCSSVERNHYNYIRLGEQSVAPQPSLRNGYFAFISPTAFVNGYLTFIPQTVIGNVHFNITSPFGVGVPQTVFRNVHFTFTNSFEIIPQTVYENGQFAAGPLGTFSQSVSRNTEVTSQPVLEDAETSPFPLRNDCYLTEPLEVEGQDFIQGLTELDEISTEEESIIIRPSEISIEEESVIIRSSEISKKDSNIVIDEDESSTVVPSDDGESPTNNITGHPDKSFKWSNEAFESLLLYLKDNKLIVRELPKTRMKQHKKDLWEGASATLLQHGDEYTYDRCWVKWKNIKKKYMDDCRKGNNPIRYKKEVEEIIGVNTEVSNDNSEISINGNKRKSNPGKEHSPNKKFKFICQNNVGRI